MEKIKYILYILIFQTKGNIKMLYTIAIVLLVLWAIGLLSSYTLGGFIHILLVIAIIAILLRIIRGKNPFWAYRIKLPQRNTNTNDHGKNQYRDKQK